MSTGIIAITSKKNQFYLLMCIKILNIYYFYVKIDIIIYNKKKKNIK